MMKAHYHLVKFALKAGHQCSVWDGEAWQVKRSTKYREIIEALESVDEAELTIRNSEGERIGWAHCIFEYGQEPQEIVANHTITPFMQEWDANYTGIPDRYKKLTGEEE